MVTRAALMVACAALALVACNAVLGIDGEITTTGDADGSVPEGDDSGGSSTSGGTSSGGGSTSSGSSSGAGSSTSGSSGSSSSGSSGSSASSSTSSGSSSSGSSGGLSSGSSSSSSSSGSSSGGSSSSSSSSSGGEVDAGPIPTTCAQANDEIGCCSGNTNYYCSTSLQSTVCSGGQVCGWGGSNYMCVDPPGVAGGGEPIDCQ